eukprot:5304322-Pyramimonas_sp.AAC.1
MMRGSSKAMPWLTSGPRLELSFGMCLETILTSPRGDIVLDEELPQYQIRACLEEGRAPFGDWSLAEGNET